MSFDVFPEPQVKSPNSVRTRPGRGFSIKEARQAGVDITEARQMGLIIDLRRKTVHEENVLALKRYVKEMKALAVEASKPKPEPRPPKEKRPNASEAAVSELSSLRAVKKAEAKRLVAAGIATLSDLAYCDIDKVAKKTGIDEDRIVAMVKAALKKI
ncbi:MAG: ribosomal protein L13e [Candidatus Thorarchaeota archaeon]